MTLVRTGTLLTLLALLLAGASAADEIRYSLSPDRSDAKPLDGALVQGEVFIFFDVTGLPDIDQVVFFKDGSPWRRDTSAPFDFVEDDAGGALPVNTAIVFGSVGSIGARVHFRSGEVTHYGADFDVGVQRADSVMEHNRPVADVKQAFENLTQQGEWLGFYLGDHKSSSGEQFELFPGSLKAHVQGLARSPRTDGPPILYVTVSEGGFKMDGWGGLLVVEMGSRFTNGERLGSNRLEAWEGKKGKVFEGDTMFTLPPSEDRVLKILETGAHPSGISMVGDILAIPDNGIHFYDCSDPKNPTPHIYQLPLIDPQGAGTGSQGVAITKLPDLTLADGQRRPGSFLLVTNGGGGAHFYFSYPDKTSFFSGTDQVDEIFHTHANGVSSGNYRHLDKDYLQRGLMENFWSFKNDCSGDCNKGRTFQGMNFVNQVNPDGTHQLFLIGSANSNSKTPRITGYGHDELVLLEVVAGSQSCGLEGEEPCLPLEMLTPLNLNLRGVATGNPPSEKTRKIARSPGTKENGIERSVLKYKFRNAYKDRYGTTTHSHHFTTRRFQGNFNAGAGAYVSPSGELLFYAASHFADGEMSESAHSNQSGRNDEWRENDFIKMAEYSNRFVSAHPDDPATGSCGAKFRANHLGGPYEIREDAAGLVLNGEVMIIEPWVRMFKNDNWSGQSVMMDWRNRELEDYGKFSVLDGEYGECRDVPYWRTKNAAGNHLGKYNGFNNCMESFFWCGPDGAELWLYKDDYKDDMDKDDNMDSPERPGGDGPKGLVYPGTGDVVRKTRKEGDPYFSQGLLDFKNPKEGGSSHGTKISAAWIDWQRPSALYSWSLDEGCEGDLDPKDRPQATYYPGIGSSTNTVRLEVMGEEVSTVIHVVNVPPAIDEFTLAPNPGSEGDQITLVGRWSDRAPTVDITVDWGDGAGVDAAVGMASRSFSFGHRYADNGIYTVALRVYDGEDATDAEQAVVVENLPPSTYTGRPQVIYEGDVLELEPATFHDAGTLDTHTANIEWGDGSPSEVGQVVENPYGPPGDAAGLDGEVYGSHQYLVPPGNYTAVVTVEDDDGATDSSDLQIAVAHGFLRFCAFADDKLEIEKDAVVECGLVPSGAPGETRMGGAASRGEVKVKKATAMTGELMSREEKVEVEKEALFEGGVRALGEIKLKQDIQILGNVTSASDIELEKRVTVVGDVTSSGEVKMGSGCSVSGAVSEHASVPPIPAITGVTPVLIAGGLDVKVKKDETRTLPPGSYGKLELEENGVLVVTSGVYRFESFEADKRATVHFELGVGVVVVDVVDKLTFKEDGQMTLASAESEAEDILFRVGGKVDLDKQGSYLGTYLAPYGELKLGEGARLEGALYGHKVKLEKESHIIGRPALEVFMTLFVTP